MNIIEVMEARHAVRSYKDKQIEENIVDSLMEEIKKCNIEGALNIQLIRNDTDVCKGIMAHFAGFRTVSNYIALVGSKRDNLEEKLGYYGEQIVLKAQELGLNTCWVGATYKRGKCKVVMKDNEKLVCVIALGYGTTQGVPHKSKSITQVCNVDKDMPTWFKNGMKAVMLAPTAQNKQDFMIELNGENVTFYVKENKFSKVDLGIIKYHFYQGIDV